MKRLALLAAGLLASGCQQPEVHAPPPRLVAAAPPPAGGLWVDLHGAAEHPAPAGHGATLSWVPVSWVVPDGAQVAAGDALFRYDVESLRRANDMDGAAMLRDDLRRQQEVLRGEASIEELRTRIRQMQARRAVVAAELAAARRTDPEEIRLSELRLADARSTHAAAQRRLAALTSLRSDAAPVSAADLAQAHEEAVRARAGLAAPTVALALARQPAAASTVRRLELTLADLDAQLGATPDEGLATALRTAIERQKRRETDRGRGRREWRRMMFEQRAMAIQRPQVVARVAGVAVRRDENVAPGAKLPRDASSVFVLTPDGMSVRLPVPERLRPWFGPGARVGLLFAALPGEPVGGTVASIGPVPDQDGPGPPSFPATVRLDREIDGLSQGMTVTCRAAFDAAPGASVIPAHCLIAADDPAVELATGGVRPLQGWHSGSWFVATAGLAVGEMVRVPDGAMAAERRQRLAALVEPAHYVPLRLSSWNWELLEALPEGTQVRKGDRIARLVKVDHWRGADTIRANADLEATQAALDLSITQLAASETLAGARTAWIRARVERDRAAIAAWVGRNAYDAVARATAEADRATARVGLERSERELVAARAEHTAGGISSRQLAERVAARERALLADQRAGLEATAIELAADWPAQRRLDDAEHEASESENAARLRAALASEEYRARLAAGTMRFASAKRNVANDLKALADEELAAPADGLLVYTGRAGQRPRPGQAISTWEPFRIAAGRERRATFEVPANRFGRIKVGDRLRLTGTGTPTALTAEVIAVANSFLLPAGFADEIALGRTIGTEERIFHVTVAFTPPDDLAFPLGSLAHAEL